PPASFASHPPVYSIISSVFLRYFFGHPPKNDRRTTEEQPKNRASHWLPDGNIEENFFYHI
ncbi:MAG: hypothetical protein IKP21_08805, partial [Bacteroidales bacterium]|nr:hypothetical protein [Bacteroidales bacterium]